MKDLCRICSKTFLYLILLFLTIGTNPGFSQGVSFLEPVSATKAREYSVILEKLQLDGGIVLRGDLETITELTTSEDHRIQFVIPLGDGEEITASLERQNVFAPSFKVFTGSGQNVTALMKESQHYYGMIAEDSSMAAFSFFEDSFRGTFSYGGNNYNLEELTGTLRRDRHSYVLYRDKDLLHPPSLNCETSDEMDNFLPFPDGYQVPVKTARSSGSVNIYLETDYQTYLHKNSSIDDVVDYTTGLFNVIAGIFNDAGGQNEGPTMILSELKIWNTPDPYDVDHAESSLDVLEAFECEAASYNGRIAHLLSTSNNNLGGIAARPNCSYAGGAIHGFSNIGTSYSSDLDVYSWSVNVLAHELGHNMSSPHTHACNWPGGQIDDCGNVYLDNNGGEPGDCYDPSDPLIPNKGTVMSYCHLSTGNGIDLSDGFHEYVADQINTFANCLTEEVSNPTASLDDIHALNVAETTATLSCDLVEGIQGYWWGYRIVGEDSYQSFYSSENSVVVDELQPNRGYEFHVVLLSGGWGAYSCTKNFHTIALDCPDELVLDEIPISDGSYFASQSIMASGQIMTNGEVNLMAGQEVNLGSGFSVEVTGTLFIHIDPDGCQ